MKPIRKALVTLRLLASSPDKVTPTEVSIALSFLQEEAKDSTSRKVVEDMSTCCKQLTQLRPGNDWRSRYQAEAWGEHLLDLCDDLHARASRRAARSAAAKTKNPPTPNSRRAQFQRQQPAACN